MVSNLTFDLVKLYQWPYVDESNRIGFNHVQKWYNTLVTLILRDYLLWNEHANNILMIYDSIRAQICMAINRAMTFQDETTFATALFSLSSVGARASFGS